MSDPVRDTGMQRGDSSTGEVEKQAGMSHFPLLVMLPYNSYSLCLTITILQHIFKQLYALLSSDYIYM